MGVVVVVNIVMFMVVVVFTIKTQPHPSSEKLKKMDPAPSFRLMVDLVKVLHEDCFILTEQPQDVILMRIESIHFGKEDGYMYLFCINHYRSGYVGVGIDSLIIELYPMRWVDGHRRESQLWKFIQKVVFTDTYGGPWVESPKNPLKEDTTYVPPPSLEVVSMVVYHDERIRKHTMVVGGALTKSANKN